MEKSAEFNPEISIHDNWLLADPLDYAWFGYAPDEMRSQYGDAGDSVQRTATLQAMMAGEVRLKLGYGELVALGIQVEPDLGISPCLIPVAMFQTDSVDIDWKKSEISGLRRVFSAVRICRADANLQIKTPLSTEEPINFVSPTTVRRGPKSAGDVIRQIYFSLIKTGEIPPMHTRKEAWVIVVKRAKQDFPAEFPGERGLSYSSFARHLSAK